MASTNRMFQIYLISVLEFIENKEQDSNRDKLKPV